MPDDAIPYIRADAVYAACTMREAVEAMRLAFAELSADKAVVPVRTHLPLASGGDALFMPAHSPRLGRHAIKVASVHPKNRDLGLDLVQALVIHFDSSTGKPIAILDGRSVTAIRTGAGSGLATDLMALPDASVAVIVGAGVQAETQLEAVCCVRPIERAYCLSRSGERAAEFAEKMTQRLGVDVTVAESRSILRDADVVCTATTSNSPVIDLDDVKPGVHINAVGTHRPHASEIGVELVCRSRLIVDHRATCMREAGEILIPLQSGRITESHILGELGEVVSGAVKGRESEDDYTLFKSVGNAIQDLYLADKIVNNINTK